MTSFDLSLRAELARYLAGEITLRQFRRWFLPLVWDQAEDNQLASPITRRVELRLAEYMNGHWTEEALKRLFAREEPQTGSLGARLRVVLTGAIGGEPPQRPEVVSQVDLQPVAQ